MNSIEPGLSNKIIKISVAVSLMIASNAFAQESKWVLTSLPEGTIYRTEVYGISTRDKITKRSRTAVSLFCTDGMQPKIFLQWENMQGYGNIKINYTIDNKPTTANGTNFAMDQDREIISRDLSTSKELLQSMKAGQILSIDWVGYDQTRYITVFNLRTFRASLNEFNKKCNTNI